MSRSVAALRNGLVLTAVLLAAACSSQEQEPAPVETPRTTQTAPPPVQVQPQMPAGPVAGTLEEFNVVVGDRVFFDLDSHTLRPEAQGTLERQAAWLGQYQGASVVIEGHADERGTREYNLALGDRRANAVRNYLVSLGVAPNRIQTISYGKERPVSVCSDESCWSQNRRGVTAVTGVPTS